jgi:hypothetical protein
MERLTSLAMAVQRPLWVKAGPSTTSASGLVFTRSRPNRGHLGTSVSGQKRLFALRENRRAFADHPSRSRNETSLNVALYVSGSLIYGEGITENWYNVPDICNLLPRESFAATSLRC